MKADNQTIEPIRSNSTSKEFIASPDFIKSVKDFQWTDTKQPIADQLSPDLFYYRRKLSNENEGHDHMEKNLLNGMPYIVTSKWPALSAAQANTQVEFDRTYRSIAQDPAYKGKNVLFISGLNIDISPQKGQLFPLTKFIPWAAYFQDEMGHQQTWEQDELFAKLGEQSTENPNQVNLESAIDIMQKEEEIQLPF